MNDIFNILSIAGAFLLSAIIGSCIAVVGVHLYRMIKSLMQVKRNKSKYMNDLTQKVTSKDYTKIAEFLSESTRVTFTQAFDLIEMTGDLKEAFILCSQMTGVNYDDVVRRYLADGLGK